MTEATKKESEEIEGVESAFPDYCFIPKIIERPIDPNISPGRLELIVGLEKKWVNGTTLHYYFFNKESDGRTVTFANGSTERKTWKTSEEEMKVVRDAFQKWKDLKIGLNFEEVNSRDDAEIRIGFEKGDGSWSYLGRDIIDLDLSPNARTMNFGWSLTRREGEIDTAIHEIGHTLGFPHEHQNPFAGIVWDEDVVYAALAKPPNRWNREKTFHNIIRKILPDSVQGSDWDSNSVMHYPFGANMILEPEDFKGGITPTGGLSARDKTWVLTFYPPMDDSDLPELKPVESVSLGLTPGEQKDFSIKPMATRNYNIQTFGISDTVIVLFEKDGDQLRYVAGDDDSGADRNALINVKLFSGRSYVLRIRLYYADRAGETAVMMW